jgi:ABC-type branched-subunit amino acid transport system substrate-binding protein
MKRAPIGGLLLALLASLPAAPASPAAPTPGVTDTEVVLGISAPLSGPASAWGSIALAAEAWARHVNATGGVHGRKLRVVVKDDAYNPGQALSNINEMKDSVFALVIQLGTAVLNACRETVAESRVPSVWPLGNPQTYASQPKEKSTSVFMAYPDYADEGEFLVSQAAKVESAKKVAVFFQNDDFGKGGVEGVKRGVKKLPGVSVAAEVPYEVAERELGTQALKLKESGADAVILYSTTTHGAAVIKEMAKVGYRPRIFASFTLGDRSVMFRLLGDLWEGAYFDSNEAVPGEPEADRVLSILLAEEPKLKGRESFAIIGATAMAATVEGLQRAGRNLTREGFVKALDGMKDFSPEKLTAPINWSASRHHGLNAVRLMRANKAADASYTQVTGYQIFPAHF